MTVDVGAWPRAQANARTSASPARVMVWTRVLSSIPPARHLAVKPISHLDTSSTTSSTSISTATSGLFRHSLHPQLLVTLSFPFRIHHFILHPIKQRPFPRPPRIRGAARWCPRPSRYSCGPPRARDDERLAHEPGAPPRS